MGDELVASVAVDPNADLVTVKTLASGDSVLEEGDTVTFQIIVNNTGSAHATNVSLTDLLPVGLTATANNGVVSQGSYDVVTGVWTIGTITDSGSATLTLEGTVVEGVGGTTISNATSAASGDQPDPGTAGDDLDESVQVVIAPTTVTAVPDIVTTGAGEPVVIDFLVNDIGLNDGVSLSAAPVLQDISSGTLILIGNDWVFTPAIGFVGEAVISYTLQDEIGNTSASTHTVVVVDEAFVELPIAQLVSQTVTVAAPEGREINQVEYERTFYEKSVDSDLIIIKAVAALSAANSDDSASQSLADTVEGSVGYSSGKGYRGTHSVDLTDECGRFFIDTIAKRNGLSVIARSTINPELSAGVVGFSATLANGKPLPEWIFEVADGEYLIDQTVDAEMVSLKIVAHRESGNNLIRVVQIDMLTGEIRELGISSDFGTSLSEELRPDTLYSPKAAAGADQ